VQDFEAANNFLLTPSIPPTLDLCPYHVDKDEPEMKQERACEYERITLCVTSSLATDKGAQFLGCLDVAPLPLEYNASFPHACLLETTGGDDSAWQAANRCFSGPRGDALVEQAQQRTAAANSGIPSVLVDGSVVCGNGVACDYDIVASHLSSN